MHGGPAGRRLAEHQHVETQLEVHFRPSLEATRTSELRAGETVIIPSGRPHVGEWEDGSEVVVLLIPPVAFERAADEILVRSRFVLRDQNLPSEPLIHQLSSSIRYQFHSSVGMSKLFIESTGNLLAEHLLRNYAETAPIARQRERFTDSQIKRLTAFVDDRLESGLTVADMASVMGMGIHRFSRLLQLATGCTPYKFVQSRRLQLAKRLLQQNGHDLADIAIRLGFASQSHFSDVFHRATGLTPNAYRHARR